MKISSSAQSQTQSKAQSKSGSAFFTSTPKAMSETSGASPNYGANLAIVSDDILPYQVGRVNFQSSWWPALCRQNICIPSGTPVRVIDRSNITLIVEPISVEPILAEPIADR